MSMDVTEEVVALIAKAERAEKSDDALKFSQAACNAANAMCGINGIQKEKHNQVK